MSLSKFLSLISTGNLHFARADLLGDPFEGTIGINSSRAVYSPPPSIRGTAAPRERVYISCWHQQPHELAAIWSVYGRIICPTPREPRHRQNRHITLPY